MTRENFKYVLLQIAVVLKLIFNVILRSFDFSIEVIEFVTLATRLAYIILSFAESLLRSF